MKSNVFIGKKTKRKKRNKYKSETLKTLMQHTKGLPPSCNWSNSFSSIEQGHSLIYISNNCIIVINIHLKSFEQTLSSNRISGNDKPNVLLTLSPQSFIAITEQGVIIRFDQKKRPNGGEGIFIEDLNTQTNSISIQSSKTALYIRERKLMLITSKSSLICFKVINEDEFRLKNEYCIPFESDITDIKLINNGAELCLAFMNGTIIILDFINNSHSVNKKLVIDSKKHDPIYAMDYSAKSKLLALIDKSGTLSLYDSVSYQLKLVRSNQFNDKSINEHYLFFALKFLPNDNILVSSNEGRIFIFGIEGNEFKEVSENPHTQSIFSIIFFTEVNYAAFISSDHLISFYFLDELNLDFTLRTIPSQPNHLLVDSNESKLHFATRNESSLSLYFYCYNKKQNNLLSIQRNIQLKTNSVIIMIKQLREFLGLLTEGELIIYDYHQDIVKYEIELKSNGVIAFEYLNYDDGDGFVVIGFSNWIIQLIKYPIKESILTNRILLKEKEKEEQMIIKGRFCIFQSSNPSNHFVYSTYESDKKIHVYLFNEIISIELHWLSIDSSLFMIQIQVNNDCASIELYSLKQKTLNYINISLPSEIHSLKYNDYPSYSKSFENLNLIKEQMHSKVYLTSYHSLFPFEQTAMKVTNTSVITAQINGIILVYESYFKDNIHTLILLSQIKAHYSKITDLAFISLNVIASISSDQSLKLWNTEECIRLNIKCTPSSIEEKKDKEIVIDTNYFSKLQDDYFYQQSLSSSKQFTEDFKAFYESSLNESSAVFFDNAIKSNCELLLFSYFKTAQLNYIAVAHLLEYELKHRKQPSNGLVMKKFSSVMKHIGALYQMIQSHLCEELQLSLNEAFRCQHIDDDIEKDWIDCFDKENSTSLLGSLIDNNCFVDALILIKILDLGFDQFILSLNQIKAKIFTKQMFQAIKIEKVIQSIQCYHKASFNP